MSTRQSDTQHCASSIGSSRSSSCSSRNRSTSTTSGSSGSKKCANCNASNAKYVLVRDGPRRCKSCRVKGDWNVHYKYCWCGMRATYGIAGTRSATHCATHGQDIGLTDVNGKQCRLCTMRATYGEAGARTALYCKTHGTELGLVEVNGKRCAQCSKRATHGEISQQIATHCSDHGKLLGLVDVNGAMCRECRTVRALFGEPGSDVATHCEAHKRPQHENVVDKPCRDQSSAGPCPSFAVKNGLCTVHQPGYVPTPSGCSREACQFFDQLERELGTPIKHAHLDAANGRWQLGEYKSRKVGGNWPVDGYIAERNAVIEYHGDHVHGHPSRWQHDLDAKDMYNNLHFEQYAKSVYKMSLYLMHGYQVYYVWSSQVAANRRATHSGGLAKQNYELLTRFDGEMLPRPNTRQKRKIADESKHHIKLERFKKRRRATHNDTRQQ